jgi:hypothetical protein
MTIKNNTGGYMKISDLGITIGPSRTIDLDTLCTPEAQQDSNDLKKLISRCFITRVGASSFKQADFTASANSFTKATEVGGLRKVVFIPS